MKARCSMCYKIVESEASIKETRGYYYAQYFDSDPCTFVAKPQKRSGFLCYDCQEKVWLCMVEHRRAVDIENKKEPTKC